MPFDDNVDLEEGGFFILRSMGMILVALGIFLIVVAYFPDLIPYVITNTLPEEISTFLINYYNAFLPEMLPHPYMFVIGLGCIAGGALCMLYEYREYLEEKAFRKEQ